MRARFNPGDGQLYITGLQGWQTDAAKITGLDRVRYTGKPVYSLLSLEVARGGIKLGFTQPLDRTSATDLENYAGQRWNYLRTPQYGSPELSVSNPAQRGRDAISLTGAILSPDARSVTLQVADLKPVMQMLIKLDIKAKDGTPIKQEIMHTIHAIP